MEGLIKEGSEILEQQMPEGTQRCRDHRCCTKSGALRNLASYRTARTCAELLGDNEVADLLEQTCEDEKETDLKLTGLAENINMEAREEERRSEAAKTRSSHKRPAS